MFCDSSQRITNQMMLCYRQDGRREIIMKASGKIIIVTNEVNEDKRVEPQILEQLRMEKILRMEQYLNDKVAVEIFQKFDVLIRVHITG